jgi:hypothetical protein
MLRSDVEVALNDLAVALRSAAHAYETMAEAGVGHDRLLVSGREDCLAFAGRLEEAIRAMGEKPKARDDDADFFRDLGAAAVGAVAPAPDAARLAELRDMEQGIAEDARALLGLNPDDELRRTVEALLRQAEAQAARLDAAIAARPDD